MKSNNENNVKMEILWFYILTYSISWLLWILAPTISDVDSLFFFWICLIGAFGPSLSAIILSLKNSRSSTIPKLKQIKVFVLTFGLCFIMGVVFFLPFYEIYFLIVGGSLIVALICSGAFSSRQEVLDLLRSLRGTSGKNYFILIAIILPLFAYIIGPIIYLLFGGSYPEDFTWLELFLSILISFPFLLVFGGPLNEEPGWRGFLLPRFQKKLNPLLSGLIIGVFWSLWHAPLHFNGFYGDGWEGFIIRLIFNPFGIILTWYYNSSEGNLLGCIFFHASINTFVVFNQIFPDIAFISDLMLLSICIIMIIQGKMWKKKVEIHQEISNKT